MNYRLAYSIGFHPWEDASHDRPFVEKAAELFAREEEGRAAPFGRALDIGTGSGIWGIELAKRGWDVTGIDCVQKALARANERVRQSGVQMRLIEGDVTALAESGVGSGFRLILDTGTFHDFAAAQRASMGRGVETVASPDATLLLLAWPKQRRPLIRGVSRDEIEVAFPGWTDPIMCLMLYIGTVNELPFTRSADLSVEQVEESRRAVKGWFSSPIIRFVGAHTGCSCGFPSVIAESPIAYFEGMRLESDDRAADLRSVRALIELIARASNRSERVELYPVADGEESSQPKGVIEWQLDSLDPERFFFNERFMHVVYNSSVPPVPVAAK